MLRIGVLISGSGTNLQEIINHCKSGWLSGKAEVTVVISDNDQALGLDRAQAAGITAVALPKAPKLHNEEILRHLKIHQVDLVVMAGYMRLLGKNVLDAFPDRVMNIHPALLPAFTGSPHAIQDAFNAGVKVSGVTVHFANEVFDEGPIIMQREVRIAEDDTVDSFEEKIHAVEYQLYPEAILLFAEGRLEVVEPEEDAEKRKVRILSSTKESVA